MPLTWSVPFTEVTSEQIQSKHRSSGLGLEQRPHQAGSIRLTAPAGPPWVHPPGTLGWVCGSRRTHHFWPCTPRHDSETLDLKSSTGLEVILPSQETSVLCGNERKGRAVRFFIISTIVQLMIVKKKNGSNVTQGTWVALSVERPTLDFCSGRHLGVMISGS